MKKNKSTNNNLPICEICGKPIEDPKHLHYLIDSGGNTFKLISLCNNYHKSNNKKKKSYIEKFLEYIKRK